MTVDDDLEQNFFAAARERGSNGATLLRGFIQMAVGHEGDVMALQRRCRGCDLFQDCRRTVDPALLEDMRFAHSSQHFGNLVEPPQRVIIVDFRHAPSDLPLRLENDTQTKRDNALTNVLQEAGIVFISEEGDRGFGILVRTLPSA